MQILHLNNTDSRWGAARAALRLHQALEDSCAPGLASVVRVVQRKTDLASVLGPRTPLGRGWPLLRCWAGAGLQTLQRSSNLVRHSASWLPCCLDRELNASAADLLHLHWVQEDMLSIEAIGRLRKPLVWTLHDAWPFCGSEHYPKDQADRRYEQGYQRRNRDPSDRGIDLDRWCWLRKRAAWRRPIHLVAPSQWMAACVQRSALMHDWPVQVIPNALPTQIYRPWPRVLARQLFDLPQEVPLLLFAAVGGGHDPRKGWDLLQHALSLLVDRLPGLEAVVCGQSEPPAPPRLGLPIHYIGYLHDDQAMALLYSAADVMVVPSRMEAFGQAASEAHSCGVPVVAFDGTGLNDVVQHRHTGYLAAAGDPVDLAAGVAWVLDAEQADRRSRLAQQARQRAEQRWSAAVVARQHAALYAQVLHR